MRLLWITNGQIILVKHSYSDQWYLPGGRVEKKETLQYAVEREVEEELGLDIETGIQVLGIYSNFCEHKSDHVVVFVVEGQSIDRDNVRRRSFEIKEVEFFPLDNLPENVSPGTKRRINEFKGRNSNKVLIERW